MILIAPFYDENGLIIGQKMDSSRRYLLQAEIEYWHEMLRLNHRVVSKTVLEEMKSCLREAVQGLNTSRLTEQRSAA